MENGYRGRGLSSCRDNGSMILSMMMAKKRKREFATVLRYRTAKGQENDDSILLNESSFTPFAWSFSTLTSCILLPEDFCRAAYRRKDVIDLCATLANHGRHSVGVTAFERVWGTKYLSRTKQKSPAPLVILLLEKNNAHKNASYMP